MREGTVFTGVCLSTFVGGTLPQVLTEVPHSQVRTRGYPIPGLDGWRYPHPRSGWYPGIPPSRLGWKGTLGYPSPAQDLMGYPHQDWMVYPHPGQDGVPPSPSRTGWGIPQGLDGVPTPVRRQSSIASTCYVVRSMPLAFTQEDFLVLQYFL